MGKRGGVAMHWLARTLDSIFTDHSSELIAVLFLGVLGIIIMIGLKNLINSIKG